MKKTKEWPRIVREGSVTVKVYRSRHAGTKSGFVHSVAWVALGGGRKLKHFADADEAIDEAGVIARRLANGMIDAAETSREDQELLIAIRQACGPTPPLAAIDEWSRARAIAGVNLVAAAEAWAAANKKTGVADVALKKAVDEFIAAKEAAGGQGEQTYRRKFKKLMGRFGVRAIQGIREDELAGFLDEIKDPVSRNDARKRMVTLWRWARDKKNWLKADALTAAERTDAAKEPARRIGIIAASTFEQCLNWIRNNQPDDLAALVLAGFCGVRSDEIHGKRHDRSARQLWADVHLDKAVVNVTVAKTNTPAWRLVPLCPATIAWLDICPRRADGTVCRPSAMEWARRGCISAGIKLPENCFRHSFISHRIAALGGNKPQVATEAGNSVTQIDARYRVPLTKADGEAWFSIFPKK